MRQQPPERGRRDSDAEHDRQFRFDLAARCGPNDRGQASPAAGRAAPQAVVARNDRTQARLRPRRLPGADACGRRERHDRQSSRERPARRHHPQPAPGSTPTGPRAAPQTDVARDDRTQTSPAAGPAPSGQGSRSGTSADPVRDTTGGPCPNHRTQHSPTAGHRRRQRLPMPRPSTGPTPRPCTNHHQAWPAARRATP